MSASPNPVAWEDAYLRFETPTQEVRKFERRLRALGVPALPRDGRVVELFCGRGSGLRALRSLGFKKAVGIDLSPTLASAHEESTWVAVGDCRALPFRDGSFALAVVQGGLHHLPRVGEDVPRALAEARRVLVPCGHLVVVEPWLTPFLRLVHVMCRQAAARRVSASVDALAAMIDHESRTYLPWLAAPSLILRCLDEHFVPLRCRKAWGKLLYLGVRRE